MKKVLDNNSGFFQLLQYSGVSLPNFVPSYPSRANSPPAPSDNAVLAPSLTTGDSVLDIPPALSRQNSNSSETSSPLSISTSHNPSSPPHDKGAEIFARISRDLSNCVSSISSGNAQCRSMLPILFEFVAHGDVCYSCLERNFHLFNIINIGICN